MTLLLEATIAPFTQTIEKHGAGQRVLASLLLKPALTLTAYPDNGVARGDTDG